MSRVGIWAMLDSKPGKERDVEDFLKSARTFAEDEKGTRAWFAVKLTEGRYAIFDTFDDEPGREAHLKGEIAKALRTRGPELLGKSPEIIKVEVIAEKGQAAGNDAKPEPPQQDQRPAHENVQGKAQGLYSATFAETALYLSAESPSVFHHRPPASPGVASSESRILPAHWIELLLAAVSRNSVFQIIGRNE